MRKLDGECLVPAAISLSDSVESHPSLYAPSPSNYESQSLRSIPLKPSQQPATIIAIDVSNIKLGETDSGLLIAIRAAVVWMRNRQYRYLRLGPFPFHITEQNKQKICHLFRAHNFQTSPNSQITPKLTDTHNRISNLLECWLQMNISTRSQDSIVLWDGSLTAGTPDNPMQFLSKLLETARHRLNRILAFAKTTTLRIGNQVLTDLTTETPSPCLIQVKSIPLNPSTPLRFLGNIYVTRFARSNCSFRLDIDKNLPIEEGIAAVEQLLGNDMLYQGYPETLRLAHIYSTFTASEVIGIQRFIAQTHGLRIIMRPNLRRLLFGPFGKGVDA